MHLCAFMRAALEIVKRNMDMVVAMSVAFDNCPGYAIFLFFTAPTKHIDLKIRSSDSLGLGLTGPALG